MSPAPASPDLNASGFSDSSHLRRHVLEELRRAMGWELTFLSRVEGGDLEVLEVAGDLSWVAPGTHLPTEATFCFRLLNGATPPFTDRLSDPDSPFHEAACREELGAESYSGHVVRRLDGSAFGTLCAIDRGSRVATAEQRRLGDTFARLLAWEIERDATLQEVARLARTDVLTGLVNRSAFYERLREEVARSGRHGAPLTLVLFDIDHFKQVNDRHGHPAGDQVLAEAAAAIRGLVRAGDVLARVGGEEFAWLLPETEGEQGWRAAERAREAIGSTAFPHGGPVTISAGVCELSQAGSPEDVYRLADRALYWAKDEGRDTCVLYTHELSESRARDAHDQRATRSQTASAVRALARAIDAKDPSTRRHSQRVADLAARLAGHRGWSASDVADMREAGLVHDVGKTGVPDAVLFKEDRLDPVEYELVKAHATLGAQIVGNVLTRRQTEWVRHHHERIDGRGYPDGIAGAQISEGARLLALADAWDAMTSSRPYSAPMSVADALSECRELAGRQFCPLAVEALESVVATDLAREGSPELTA